MREELNLAAVHEAIAAAVPDRECLVWRDRRLTWADVTDRSRRFAAVLRDAGLGTTRPLAACEGWESPHDHVALYLHNGNEYLEALLGAAKARAVGVNVNYRYVAEELRYVLLDSGARAIVYHGAFAPTLREVLPSLAGAGRSSSRSTTTPGPRSFRARCEYEAALAAAEPPPPEHLSPDDLYILYTGGTTGHAQGRAVAPGRLPGRLPRDPRDHRRARRGRRGARACAPFPPRRSCTVPPTGTRCRAWTTGGTVVVQDHPARLDPHDVLDTVERERATSLLIVGDAFARPLVDALRARDHDASSLRHLLTGGATLSAHVKEDLLELLPDLRIVDVLGSSETGRQGVQTSDRARGASTGTFERAPTSVVLSEDLTHVLAPGATELGWLAQTGRVPRGYLGDPEKTARTFPDGGRCAARGGRRSGPGARRRVGGALRPRLRHHQHGRREGVRRGGRAGHQAPPGRVRRGRGRPPQRAVGPGGRRRRRSCATAGRPTDEDLRATAAEHVARYKLPKAVVRVPKVERSPSGKPDYRWAAQVAKTP